jgi:hypothetical protein
MYLATLNIRIPVLQGLHILSLTVKKEKKIFLICNEIQKRSGTKSCMRKGFLIYEEMCKYLVIYGRPLVMYDFTLDPF